MGILYLTATPLGNLEDITLRAARVLKEVDFILAEDTRRSGKLIAHLEIENTLKPFHDHNKERVTPAVIERLNNGADTALISDAGTPGIADPAYYLVKEAYAHKNIKIVPVPGPCALPALISASGLPSDRFIFENFLPSKSTKRKKIFQKYSDSDKSVLFFESPHRIIKVLNEIDQILPETHLVIGREMTKIHEEFIHGKARDILEHFSGSTPKGEFTVMLYPGKIKH